MLFTSRFQLDAELPQRIVPIADVEQFEGIDFSPSGSNIAIATSKSNEVLLFRRGPDGRFEEMPYRKFSGSSGGLDYPHDVSFSRCGNTELLAVAQRRGAIAIYQANDADHSYGSEPVWEIRGPELKLDFSDGVAFVPPDRDHIAACNLNAGSISVFRRSSISPVRFEATPAFELRAPSIVHPDGLAFSLCGRWLAVANHGGQSVSIFERSRGSRSEDRLSYGPEPVTVITDPQFRYPHSVAFTPRNHLIVTNAGANYFTVYAPKRHWSGMQWRQTPVSQVIVHDDDEFREVNTANKMEGGPKGVAVHSGALAICSPQIGVKIYAFCEGWF